MTRPSWGNYPTANQQEIALQWRSDALPPTTSLLPHGMGRSYGDVALNDGGTVITTSRLNHIISFDAATGQLRCEAGVPLADILQLVVPHGWFLPVTPGTKFVSVGGAIANDIHGKNHHRAGTFGRHVTEFELLRSNNERIVCSATQHSELFSATIGGLGLTGLITWAQIQLLKIPSVYLDSETIKMHSLNDFMALSDESDTTHAYTVAWLDTSTAQAGRGLFMRANFTESEEPFDVPYQKPLVTLPFHMPDWFVNTPLIKAFNVAYYHKQLSPTSKAKVHYNPFFYPLDILQYWNRLYGKRGFQSYQCVVPNDTNQGKAVIERMLTTIHASGLASPLTVVKLFGDKVSPGILSFPRPGINLLLDFPNVGTKLSKLLHTLDDITLEAGGRANPAKDAHMSAKTFQAMYPNWREFSEHIDPAFSSSFWRRVTKSI